MTTQIGRSRDSRHGWVTSVAMLAPYLLLLVTFGFTPIVLALKTSMKPSIANHAGGWRNYLLVIHDFRIASAVTNVIIFIAIYVPAMVLIVTLMALLLDSLDRRWTIPLRVAYIVPASMAGSVSILVWYFMLEPTLSPYRSMLAAAGITRGDQVWSKPHLAVIFAGMAFFSGAGNWIIVQYGSLQSIDGDLVEAARIDGANALQMIWRIKLPLIRRYLVYMGILVFAAGLQVFVEPQLISSSVYPGLAANWSLNQLSYSFAFANGNLGSSAALSLMLLVACMILSLFMVFRTSFFSGTEIRRRMKHTR